MAYAAKIFNTVSTLDISTGKYSLGADFIPPAAISDATMSDGLAANVYGGATKQGEKHQTRNWSFTIRVTGASGGEVSANLNTIINMLRQNSGPDPLMIGFRSNGDVPVPLYGQFGAWRTYVITHATYALGDKFTTGNVRNYYAELQVNLTIDPHANGLRQRATSASGGIIEDVLGSTDKTSRGLVIPEATTNKVINPVFGASTYDTTYTATNVVIAKNTDPRFCLPGLLQSMKVVGAPGGSVRFSLNAGNTNTHSFSFYVKREDSAAITSADCVVYYNAAKASTYTSLGDGWWRVDWIGAGINASTGTGLDIPAGRKVYIGGIQVEEKAAVTPLAYGDMLGCAWTSTAHNSTSTRTAGKVAITTANDTAMRDAGSIVLVWKSDEANTMAGNRVLFSLGAGVLLLQYLVASDTFKFFESVNAAESGAQVFAAGTTFRFVCTWASDTGVNLYINGVLAGTDAQYAIQDFVGSLTVGSSAAAAFHANGIFIMPPQSYDRALTQAEVTAIDAELAAIIASGVRPSDWSMPWFHTIDGDNVLDNCFDTTYHNYGVAGGIPGTAPAKTIFQIAPSVIKSAYWLGIYPVPTPYYRHPVGQWIYDYNTDVRAGYSGGKSNSFGFAGSTDLTEYSTSPYTVFPKTFYTKHEIFFRAAVDSSTVSFLVNGTASNTNNAVVLDSVNAKSITITTTPKIFHAGSGSISDPGQRAIELGIDFISANVILYGGNAARTLYMDYIMTLPGDVMRIEWNTANASLAYFIIDGKNYYAISSGTGLRYFDPVISGVEELTLYPNAVNYVGVVTGASGEDHAVASTLTFTAFVTPRWSLL